MKRFLLNSKSFIITFVILNLFVIGAASGQATITSAGDGNWNSTTPNAPWPGGVVPSSLDNVQIRPGDDITVTVNATINSIVFLNTSATSRTLTVNSGVILTVSGLSGNITLQNAATGNTTAVIAGLGTINCASLNVGGTVIAPNLTGDGLTTLTSTITNLSITGNLSVRGIDDGMDDNSVTLDHQSGSISVGGTVALNEDAGTTVLYDMTNGAQSGTLTLSGATPFTITNSPTFDPNAGTTTVVYSGGVQTVLGATYRNLTLSGSGIKTTTGVTVSVKLSMQGTATAGNAITYSTAILEYKGSLAQTTSTNEFPAAFTQLDEVIIDNVNGVTLNAAKTSTTVLLTMTSGTLDMANTNLSVGSLAGSGNLTHASGAAGARTLTVAGNASGSYSGVISDGTASSVLLTKSGSGTLTLSGANSYTGKTTISAGTISINTIGNVSGGNSALGNPSSIANGTVDIGATGILRYTGSGHSSDRAINLTADGGTIDASGSGLLNLSGGVGGIFNLNLIGTGTATESGAIATGVGSTLTKNGTGTWTVTGSNNFSGAVTITQGTLSVNSVANAGTSSPLGNGNTTPAISIAAAGILQYTGAGHSTSRSITLTGDGATVDASGSGTLTLSGGVTGGFNINLAGSGVGIESGIINTGAGSTLTKIGTGSWTVSNANTYTGTTTVSAGTLIAGASVAVSVAGPFGNSAAAVVLGNAATTANNSSAALILGGAFTMARPVTVANQATTGTYSIGANTDNNSTFSGVITFSQPFSVTQVATTGTNTLSITAGITGGLAGNKTVTFDNAGLVTISTAAISNGTGTTLVRKINNGTLVMNVANTYTGGTTLNVGAIRLSNTAGLGAAAQAVTLNGGFLILATNTTVNAYNITVGGNASIASDRSTAGAGIVHTLGTLSIGNFTLFSYLGTNVNDGLGGLTFGATTLSAATPVFDVSNGGMNVILGALSGNNAFNKAGGGQLTLGTASGRTGGTVTLVDGTLRLSNAAALGTIAVPLQLNLGTLELATDATVNAYNTTVGGNVTIMSNRATAGAGITHILGTLSIGANTLTSIKGANSTSGTSAVQFGNFTMTGAPTLSQGTANMIMAGTSTGAFKLTKSGTGTLQKTTADWTLGGDFEITAGTYDATTRNTTLVGNWLNNGGTHTASGASTVIFNGSSLQTIGGGTSTTFNAVTINNAAGATIAISETVNSTLTLTSGKLNIPTGNVLTIANGNAISGSGFDANKHIATMVDYGTGAKGFVRVNNLATSAAYVLPVGDGTNYLPVTLTPSDVPANNSFNVCVFQGITDNGEPNGTAFSTPQKNNCVDAVWTVNYNGPGTPTAASTAMTVGWPASLEGINFQAYSDVVIGIAHWDGPNWGVVVGSGDNTNNTATRSNITQFSPFGVGRIDPTGGVLAIKINYFNASKGNGFNTLNWQAACSSAQAIFELERSTDGVNFITINSITASQARCASPFSYNDNTAPAGTVFYRIRIIDVDGKASYSAIVKLSSQVKDIELSGIAPNPVMNIAQVKVNTSKKDVVALVIISTEGKVVYNNSVQLQPGASVINVDISNLPSGVYMIKGIFGDGQTNTVKFIKQ